MKVCILIRVAPGKGKAALEAVKRFSAIKKVHLVFGRYDIVAFAEAQNYEAVSTLTANINAIKELKSTESLIEA